MNPKSRTVRVALVAATVLALATPQVASAFRMIQNTGVGRFSAGAAVRCNANGGFTHWSNANISWRLNTANQGNGKSTALSSALASWTNVASANHNLTNDGTTTAGFSTDGVNTVLWASGNGCTGSCLAITALVLASGQVITETDISFNNTVAWNTNGSDYDTQAVMAHEIGHSLGIHHTEKQNTPRPTMYAYYFGTTGQTLETDDQSALQCAQNRYPISAPAFAREAAGGETSSRSAVRLASRARAGGAVLRFSLATDEDVVVSVFDLAGREMARVFEGRRGVGDHELAWDGSTRGGQAASGKYFARLVTRSGQSARATVILAE